MLIIQFKIKKLSGRTSFERFIEDFLDHRHVECWIEPEIKQKATVNTMEFNCSKKE